MIPSIPVRLTLPYILCFALGLLVAKAYSAAFASGRARVSIEDPLDRRVIDEIDPTISLSPGQLQAKKDEATAMLLWFEGSLKVHEAEFEAHLIEVKYNKLTLQRLRDVTGAIAGVRILEAEMQVDKDAVFTRQLETMIEMAKADVEAARARLRYLEEEH